MQCFLHLKYFLGALIQNRNAFLHLDFSFAQGRNLPLSPFVSPGIVEWLGSFSSYFMYLAKFSKITVHRMLSAMQDRRAAQTTGGLLYSRVYCLLSQHISLTGLHFV